MATQSNIAATNKAIDALGGHKKVAELFGDDERVAVNWRVRGFSPTVYAALAPLLAQQGFKFSTDLFRQRALAPQRKDNGR